MHKPLLASFVLAALATASLAHAQPQPPPAGPRVQTTADANRESLSGAAQAPLRDLNVVRTEVPPALVDAMSDPYGRPKSKRCTELNALILPLNDALGADLDAPAEADTGGVMAKGRPMALGAMAGMASDFIPFRGVVRQVSGAARHDAYVQAAITAGFTRRAYLKGLGEARGCRPPATPSHARAQDPAVAAARETAGVRDGGGLKPRYPVR